MKIKNKVSIAAIILILAAVAVRVTDLDDRIWYYFHDLKISEKTKQNSVWLPAYEIEVTEFQIPGVSGNASGITYDHDANNLWVVVNSPPMLIEMDMQFNLLRRFDLKNFKDPEGVTYAGNGLFLLTDERDQTILLAKIDSETEGLDRNELQQISLNVNGYGNKGLEGVAVDHATNTIYVVRERDPMKLLEVTGFIENDNHISISDHENIKTTDLYLDDLSGLHYDAKTNNLLILSDESKLLAEIDLEGNKVSYMELEKGFNGLEKTILQAEGVTMDEEGRLYVVSEPNLVYRYRKLGE